MSLAGRPGSARVAALIEDLVLQSRALGHEVAPLPDDADAGDARLVINLTTAELPVAHVRRTGLQQFAVSIIPLAGLARGGALAAPADVLARAYPVLLRTLSNAVVAVDEDGGPSALVTPELGVRPLLAGGGGAAGAVLEAILPLAGTTFAIDNEVREDLPPALLASPRIDEIRAGGRRMAALGLLPSVVRLGDILSREDLALLRAVFGLQQISYGNLSAREPSGGFWMTGRGVDKACLRDVGRDLLLVTGHDEARGRLRIRVPAGCGDARASVDALEHALLYEAFPGIGAIVHVHAWMDGVAATSQNWPCGTAELARDVRDLVGRQPDPACAEVGLRNHGLTLTGPDVAAIFERVEGRLRREIPCA